MHVEIIQLRAGQVVVLAGHLGVPGDGDGTIGIDVGLMIVMI